MRVPRSVWGILNSLTLNMNWHSLAVPVNKMVNYWLLCYDTSWPDGSSNGTLTLSWDEALSWCTNTHHVTMSLLTNQQTDRQTKLTGLIMDALRESSTLNSIDMIWESVKLLHKTCYNDIIVFFTTITISYCWNEYQIEIH